MFLPHASDTEALGARLAAALLEEADASPPSPVAASIHLRGRLGAGKTTLVRGLARALGIQGPIKSPTYTLVEPYTDGAITLYHIDLYRLGDGDGNSGGDELEYLGLRDAFAEPALVVIEWPERAEGRLPEADLHVHLTVVGAGRDARVSARTARGEALLAIFQRGRPS
jgi:tRNA threonylcarbamoyladenosine biosynthesis protein TsaE